MSTNPTSYQPKDLIMDLMRAVASEPMDVKMLVGIGAIFGFNGNQIRVAVTRLCQSQQLRCQERGIYELGDQGQESVLFARDWRLGEDRLRAWDGDWSMVTIPAALERSRSRRALQALQHLGFRQGLRSLFVRPANLWLSTEQLRQRLRGLGLDDACHLWIASGTSADLCQDWSRLWDDEGWEEAHHSARLQLELSLDNLYKLPTDDQLRESFILGGESIRLLVTDPLLPPVIAQGKERQLHAATMQTYNDEARKLWLRKLQDWRNES